MTDCPDCFCGIIFHKTKLFKVESGLILQSMPLHIQIKFCNLQLETFTMREFLHRFLNKKEQASDNDKIKIIICDDHALFRIGMRNTLKTRNDFELIGEAENGQDLLGLLETL